MSETILTNARLVLADEVIDGTLVFRGDEIAEIDSGQSHLPGALDFAGDLLIPGLVELHTDNLEKHLTPRPSTEWPAISALIAHDGQMTAAGITTVYDAVAVGAVIDGDARTKRLHDMIGAVEEGIAHDLLRAEHRIHLRCEVSFPGLPELLDPLIGKPVVGLVSVMDHTPGQRQFVREEKYRIYYKAKFSLTDAEIDDFIVKRKQQQLVYSDKQRRYVVERAQSLGLGLASHDDATEAHVAEAVADGVSIAEFPTTVEAARACHENGLSVMMGGPNMVRGGSHSGNVSAMDLARNGLLDAISSDYVPNSLLHAAFLLFDDLEDYGLPRAIRTVTKTPAEAAGLADRGELAIGKRADLLRVRHTPHHPLIRGVWRQGHRIA